MAWTIKGKVKVVQQLTPAEDKKWDTFVAELGKGKAPIDAAKAIGDVKYTKLKGSSNQFEIRLSGGRRATFVVDEGAKQISQVQVGGHT
jgi:hypothetical protein